MERTVIYENVMESVIDDLLEEFRDGLVCKSTTVKEIYKHFEKIEEKNRELSKEKEYIFNQLKEKTEKLNKQRIELESARVELEEIENSKKINIDEKVEKLYEAAKNPFITKIVLKAFITKVIISEINKSRNETSEKLGHQHLKVHSAFPS